MPLPPALAKRSVVTAAGKKVKLTTLVENVIERPPTAEDIATAATLLDDPSPAMLEGVAQWLGVLRDLESLTPRERVDVFTWAVFGLDARYVPSAELWERDLDALGAAARPWALDIVTRWLAKQLPGYGESLASSAAEVLVKHPGDGPSADELLALASYYASERATRTIVAAASLPARAAWLHRRLGVDEMKQQAKGAELREYMGNRVENLLPVLDLCGDDACRAELEPALALLTTKRGKPLVDQARAALDGERHVVPQNESAIANATAYVQRTSAAQQTLDDVPSAIAGASKRAVAVAGVAELADFATWKRAKPTRRAAIARAVAAALGSDFTVAKQSAPAGLALLEHRPTKHRYALVPGGTFVMGLGKREEATIRAAAKQADKEDNYDEQFGALLANVKQLRPVRKVRVAPFLLACRSTDVAHLSGLVALLANSRFRLPSEAEWEYAARGGVADELTPQGNAVPAAPKSFTSRFGLDDLGHLPEACADAFAVGYTNARLDATPRAGKGPRVVRGGAAYVYPWQSCGEWQLSCNAIRTTTTSWDDDVAVRLAIGLSV